MKKKITTKKKATKRIPRKIWGVLGNGYGFSAIEEYHWNDELKSWWTKDKEQGIEKLGLVLEPFGIIQFSSTDLQKVKTFSAGYLCCCRIVQNAIGFAGYTNDIFKLLR